MKIFKLKAGLFCLCALFFSAAIITSCSHDEGDTESIVEEQVSVNTEDRNYILPWGFEDDMSFDQQLKFLNSKDKTALDELAMSATVLHYFEDLDKRNILEENAKHGDIFDETTVTSLLSEEEASNFELLIGGVDAELESRWGCQCDPAYYVRTRCGFRGVYGQINYLRFDLYKKECHAWYCPDRWEERNYRRCY